MIKSIKTRISAFFISHPHINTCTIIIDWILRIAGLWYLLIFIGWIPGYICEWHRDKSILPFPNLFSGQNVKLDFDLYGNISRRDIEAVTWSMSKGLEKFATSNDLTPTFPLTEGGIFQLNVIAKVADGSTIHGQSNLNVIETKITPFIAEKPTNITLKDIQNTPPKLIDNIQSKGIEIYSGNGQWQSSSSISVSSSSASINLKKNEIIPTFNGQVLYRVKDSVNKFSDYGTATIQNTFQDNSPHSLLKK